jgi:hypothetical protein
MNPDDWPGCILRRLRCSRCGQQAISDHGPRCPDHPQADLIGLSEEEAAELSTAPSEPRQGELFG